MADIDRILAEELPPDAIAPRPAAYNASDALAAHNGRQPTPPQLVEHRWRPGESGNPAGGQVRQQQYTFTRALREASSPRKALAAAEMAWEMAGAGNLKAMELVRDSLEGKPGVRIADGEWDPAGAAVFQQMMALRAMSLGEHSLIVEGDAQPEAQPPEADG